MKNLEKEYKEQISLETPDLWSRIEAGVDAYEASKAGASPDAASPETGSPSKIVKFDSKRFINIIGRVSVAAIVFLVLTVTYNVTRHSRKAAAPEYAADTATADFSATESAKAEATYEAEEGAAVYEDLEAVTESATETEAAGSYSAVDNSLEDTSPALSTDAASHDKLESKEATAERASDSKAVSTDEVESLFGIGATESVEFLSTINKMGLLAIHDLQIIETSLTDTSSYGFTAEGDEPVSIASFKSGSKPTGFLLFYRVKDSAIDILAVKEAGDSGAFIYTKPVTE